MRHLMIYLKKLHAFAGIKLYINLIGMSVISLIEGFGILMLVPMLGIIGIVEAGEIPVVSALFEPLQHLPGHINLPVVLGIFVAIIVVQAVLKRFQTKQNVGIQQGFMRSIRLEIYQGLLQANWSFFVRQRKSDFNHVMTQELARVGQGTMMSLSLSTTILFTVIQIGLAFWLSPQLTAAVLGCGLILAFFSRRFVKRAKTLGDQNSEISRSFMGGMTDHFNGIKDIKSNRLEEIHLAWFRNLCRRMEHNFNNFAAVQANSQFIYRTSSAVLIALFVYLSLETFHVPVEELLLVVIIFSRLWPRFMSLQSSWEQIVTTIPAFKSLLNLKREYELEQEMDIQIHTNIDNPIRIEQGIECRNVYFRYDREQPSYALQDINLRIPANSMTAVVGKSGAGKSTLIDLLIGLTQPERGQVLADGFPLTGSQAIAFRNTVSYVSQDPFLFHASIRENLMLVAPDATEEQLWQALAFSAADDFVKKLPNGLDTVLGDRGVRLSGGERQRVVLARAILRKPSVLVLDEATSALDIENEAKIQGAIERLKGQMTIIVIAHRLSTIRNADQVIVLEKGTVIQQGGYQQLSEEKRGTFSKLLEFQMQSATNRGGL
ncbi:ABC transporter ATP-binding protein [Paenibacillus tarimensis]